MRLPGIFRPGAGDKFAMRRAERLGEASRYAACLHRNQERKGTDIPYVSHLFAVAAIVMEAGGSEDEVIAALLHDAVEDQGGEQTLAEIRKKFGKNVAGIVQGCTDDAPPPGQPKKPWRERKEAYIKHVGVAPGPVRLVSNADKLHNAKAILADYRAVGDRLWERFNAGKDDIMWYYRQLADIFVRVDNTPLAHELHAVVRRLEALVFDKGTSKGKGIGKCKGKGKGMSMDKESTVKLFHGEIGITGVMVDCSVSADGAFTLSGQDIGDFVEEVWGHDDYEYWYTLSPDATRRMLLQLVKDRFGGSQEVEKNIRRWLDEKGIAYEFSSWP